MAIDDKRPGRVPSRPMLLRLMAMISPLVLQVIPVQFEVHGWLVG